MRRPALSLSFLRERPVAVLNGRELLLTLRRAELLALLALHPGGLTAEQLALQLYGEDGNPTTARAEVHRLRAQLGEQVMQTKPYRLRADVDADFLTAPAALRDGDTRAALAAFQAPLLVRSEAPAIRAERDEFVAALRRAVLGRRGTRDRRGAEAANRLLCGAHCSNSREGRDNQPQKCNELASRSRWRHTASRRPDDRRQ